MKLISFCEADLISNSYNTLETGPLADESDDSNDGSKAKQDCSKVVGALGLWKLLLACVKDKAYVQGEDKKKSKFWSKFTRKQPEAEVRGA